MKNKFKYTKIDIPKSEYELISLMINKNVYFLYDSLNYRKLKQKIEDAIENNDKDSIFYGMKDFHIWGMKDFKNLFPDISDEFTIQRVGKLRDISFDPNGNISKFRIGNKRARTFYLGDFGKSVFPITTNYYEINYSVNYPHTKKMCGLPAQRLT